MIKKITLTEDHLKLIPFLFIEERGDNLITVDKTHLFSLGSHLLEDMAMILGLQDKAIKGTEEAPEGRAYPDDVEKYMLDLHSYLVDNLFYIETLIHQFATRGGLKATTYKCKDNELLWTIADEDKKEETAG